jgi:hypothetical protein
MKRELVIPRADLTEILVGYILTHHPEVPIGAPLLITSRTLSSIGEDGYHQEFEIAITYDDGEGV